MIKSLSIILFLSIIGALYADNFLDNITFEKIDLNHNNRISLKEIIAASNGDQRAVYAYKILDMDVNGYVDRREFDYFYQQLQENYEEIERRLNGTNIDLK